MSLSTAIASADDFLGLGATVRRRVVDSSMTSFAVAEKPSEIPVLEAIERADYDRAVDLLMDAYGSAVYRFCVQMTGSPDLADDVLQITFVQAYEGLPKFRRQSALSTWLFGIARHRCLDALKTGRRRSKRFPLTDAPPERPQQDPTIEDRLGASAFAGLLRDCLDALAEHVREAILLRYQEDMSYAEMAGVLGARAATLQARVARSMPKLRRCLEDKGGAP